jgi:hypothetical protein
MSWSCLYSDVWCRGLGCIRVFNVVVLSVFGCLMSWSCLYSDVWCRGLVYIRQTSEYKQDHDIKHPNINKTTTSNTRIQTRLRHQTPEYSDVWCRGLGCIRVFDVVVLFIFGCLMSWSCLYSDVWCRGLVCIRVFDVVVLHQTPEYKQDHDIKHPNINKTTTLNIRI